MEPICKKRGRCWHSSAYSYSESATPRTISFHCSHMAHRIIKLNMKPMSHGEAKIIREITSVLTAGPLERLCQLYSLQGKWKLKYYAWGRMAYDCSLINIAMHVRYCTFSSQTLCYLSDAQTKCPHNIFDCVGVSCELELFINFSRGTLHISHFLIWAGKNNNQEKWIGKSIPWDDGSYKLTAQ